MKRLVLIILFLCLPAFAQTPQNTKRVSVSQLPSAADNVGKTYVVTDASTTSDCTVGGGSLKVRCTSDGSNWVSDTADYVPKTTTVNGHALNTAVVVTAADVGLGNVDNTSDANKPVSTAQQAALDLKANIASPTFTGTVAGITKSMVGLGSVDNTADTAKPVSTAQQTALDLKANLASPTLSGTPSLPSGTISLGSFLTTAIAAPSTPAAGKG